MAAKKKVDADGGESKDTERTAPDSGDTATSGFEDDQEDLKLNFAALKSQLDEVREKGEERDGDLKRVAAQLETLTGMLAKQQSDAGRPKSPSDTEKAEHMRVFADRLANSNTPWEDLLVFLEDAERKRDTAMIAEIRKLQEAVSPEKLGKRLDRVERDAKVGKGGSILFEFMRTHPAIGEPENEVLRQQFGEMMKYPGMDPEKAYEVGEMAQIAHFWKEQRKGVPNERYDDFMEAVDSARDRIVNQEKLRSERKPKPDKEFIEGGLPAVMRGLSERAGLPVPESVASGKPRLEPV